MNIWFNHWFSTVYHIFGLVKHSENEIRIVASNIRENMLVKSRADEWFLEPLINSEDEYVDYCIEKCKEYKIDVFIPRRYRNAISKNIERFTEIGVKVLINDNYEVNTLLNNKIKMYEKLKEDTELKKLVPYYLAVNDVSEFKSACVLARYYIESTDCTKICMKNAVDEGATSFKILLDDKKATENDKLQYNSISEKEMEKIIEKNKELDILIMPYMQDEVSCDVIKTSKGIIVATKRKIQDHTYLVAKDEEFDKYCKSLVEKFDIKGPCNIQFRKINGNWKLLDINLRMSGGIQISSLGSGVNIPLIALNQLLNKDDTNWDYSDEYLNGGSYIGNIDTPILLRR